MALLTNLRQPDLPRAWLVALCMALALTLVAAGALWHLRQDAFDSQARELGLLSLALSDEVDRGLQGTEEGLVAVRREIGEKRLPLAGAATTPALRTRAALMPLVRSLWLVDQQGQTLASSDTSPAPAAAFQAFGAQPLSVAGVAVSRPFMGLDSHVVMVALSMPLDGPDRRIVAGIPADNLLGAFSAAAPAADARMAVYRRDGALLAGWIVKNSPLAQALVAQRLAIPKGIELHRFRDGSQRLVSQHDLPRYGLTVVLTRDLEVVLLGWREAAQLTVLVVVLILLIMAAATTMVQRADRRRTLAQQALQAQQMRTSKLESMGTLAGGVAHDFNNVLAAIVGFGEMAQDAAERGSKQARHLDKVLQAALRGKALAERILAFSRGGAHASIVFRLAPVVEEALDMLAVSLRPGVVIEQELKDRDACLRGDPTLAFESVMNLCTNAIQAMPGGGMVSVALQRHLATRPQVLSHSELLPGKYLCLSVTDQGEGISAGVMDHLFEPFFTTRAARTGTGLGLAVVHGVVAEFGGAIDVQSSPGHGATFTLYLPESDQQAVVSEASPVPLGPAAGQSLLVVDDEPALVTLAEEMLESLGYQGVGFTDPLAALAALHDDPQRFAAIMTDEVMPGLSGTELARRVHEVQPELPVLLVSGYGGALLAQRAAAVGIRQVLTKPLQRAVLAQALAKLLS